MSYFRKQDKIAVGILSILVQYTSGKAGLGRYLGVLGQRLEGR
jgi:hypothetical protein